MNDAEKLIILKKDLQQEFTTANDDYLTQLLDFSKKLMEQEGIKYEEAIECEMINVHYAAYLFRKRAGKETSMPRFLRYELNNLLFSQKGRAE